QEEAKLNGIVILAKDSEKGLLNKTKSLKEELEANKFDFSKLNIQNGKLNSELQKYHGDVVKLKKQLKDNKELLTKNNADYALHYSKYVDSIASTSNELQQTKEMFYDLKNKYDANITQAGKNAKIIEDLNIEIEDLKLRLESKRGNVVTRALKKIG
ncbi:MAG: hypothetical protein ACRC6N_12730, partial [Plesiomonas sp.]|uniref:hypothetical protein n=1 Tax=Plesiomonas sp. TaxID=2486279 RepID=UPI003F419757